MRVIVRRMRNHLTSKGRERGAPPFLKHNCAAQLCITQLRRPGTQLGMHDCASAPALLGIAQLCISRPCLIWLPNLACTIVQRNCARVSLICGTPELLLSWSFVSQICDPPDPPICLWKNKTATLLFRVRGRDPRGGKSITYL